MPLFPAYVPQTLSENLTTDSNLLTGEESVSSKECVTEKSQVYNLGTHSNYETSSSSSDSGDDLAQYPVSSVPKRPHSPVEHHLGFKRRHKSISQAIEGLYVSLENFGFVDVEPAPTDTIVKSFPQKKTSKKRVMKEFRKSRYFYKTKKKGYFTGAADDEEEEEAVKKTEEFNVSLRHDPHNIQLWLDYVTFQDSLIGETRPRTDKKLSILERALLLNPNSVELTQHMFLLMDTFSSANAMECEAKKCVAKDKKNTAAWQWLIRSCLFSMTEFSVPKVLEAYSTGLEALFRVFPSDSQPLLDLLLECCVFLRQAGLWEQLWTLVRLSLQLNLSTPGSDAFNVPSVIDKDKIRKTEDEVIVSGLPLSSLWTRLEYLRSCVYFQPSETDEEDPQRVVFPSDVANLLHPVTSSYTPRLIAILLSSLKVPMLPMTHGSVRFVGLDKISWAVESAEFLLAVFTHPHLINQRNKGCLKVCSQLIVSPQYLVAERPGCREFFHCVDCLFEDITVHVGENSELQDAVAVWRMRWLRLIPDKLDHGMKLLKAFPENLSLYTEYAVLAFSNGETGTCFKVLERCLKLTSATPVLHIAKKRDKQHLAYLYCMYIELLITMDVRQNRNKILRLLLKLVTGENVKDENIASSSVLQLKKRFESVSKEMLRMLCTDEVVGCNAALEDLVLPSVEVSWLSLHAWFLFTVDSPVAAKDHLQWVCGQLPKPLDTNSPTLGSVIVEGCYDALVRVLDSGCQSHLPDCFPVMKQVLGDALQLFPCNLFFLHSATSVDLVAGRQWSVSKTLPYCGSSVFVKLFDVFVLLEKISDSVSEDEKVSSERRLHELVKRVVAEGEQEWRRCPLLWRLVLQSVAAQHPDQIKSTFYRAADLCPWVKCIYYDAAKMLPEEMGHIQDLLVEKELRIHITSEELQVLREETDNDLPRNDEDNM